MDSLAEDYRSFVDNIYLKGIPSYPRTEIALKGLIANQNAILEKEKGTLFLSDLKPWLEYYFFRQPIK
jgi:hypothetical protein